MLRLTQKTSLSNMLKGQKKQVYEYLRDNPGVTVREMNRNMFPGVDKVSARLSELQQLGVHIEKLGRNKHREMMYSIGTPLTKQVSSVEIIDGRAVETIKSVNI